MYNIVQTSSGATDPTVSISHQSRLERGQGMFSSDKADENLQNRDIASDLSDMGVHQVADCKSC